MDLLEYKYKCCDALKFIKKLPDESVKLIITSPPYNIGKEYETKENIKLYLKKMEPILKECVRVLKKDGSICWQIGTYIENGEVYPLDIYFYPLFKSLNLQLRNRIVWHFGHGLHCSKRFSGRYETILWFTKTDNYTFNLDDVRIPSKYPGKTSYRGKNKGKVSSNPKGKNPEDVWQITIDRLYDDWEQEVWDIPNVKANHPEKVNHPCQYPIELAERCVLALTDEHDIVYDPFSGVASTLLAALKNNRIAYGTELEQKYIDIGLDRIDKLKKDKLKMRPIYQTIFVPNPKSKVATKPK